MSRVRRAFLMASLEQYLALAVNFIAIAVLARLLTPSEIGLAVVAMGITAAVFSLREFATAEFLIQRTTVEHRDVRTAFTVMMAFTLALGAGIYFIMQPLAAAYHQADLPRFLMLGIIAAFIEVVSQPAIAMLRREMAFGVIARIHTVAAIATAAVTILLAWLGYGYMSYAWGLVASAVAISTLTFIARPAWDSFRPSLASWRDVASFGRYRGATSVIERAYETIPQLLLGWFMPMSTVAFYNRANAICSIPDRILLSAVFSVAFPAFAVEVREGRGVKRAYLRALSYITVIYWPALMLLVITADTVVRILLGPNWTEVVPLVQVLSLAALAWFPIVPANSLLLATGNNRDAFLSTFVARCAGVVILCSASFYGVMALAASQLVALPLQMIVALHYVRKHIDFEPRELLAEILPSAIVALCSMAGPLGLAAALGWRFDFSIGEFCLVCLLGAVGWAGGLFATRHPFLDEVRSLLQAAGSRTGGLLARSTSLSVPPDPPRSEASEAGKQGQTSWQASIS